MTKTIIVIATMIVMNAFATDVFGQDKQFIYPSAGQSPEQKSEDRYDCHVWAVEQSGFDPSTALVVTSKPVSVEVERGNANATTAKAILAGAVLGGVIGSRGHDAAEGVAIGAVVGAVAGSAIEENAQEEARADARARVREQMDIQQEQIELQNRKRSDYRHGLAACMEGLGYTVR